MATVALEGIDKYFGTVPAVQDLSCTIAQGEFLALLGPSGCGKTTTAQGPGTSSLLAHSRHTCVAQPQPGATPLFRPRHRDGSRAALREHEPGQ